MNAEQLQASAQSTLRLSAGWKRKFYLYRFEIFGTLAVLMHFFIIRYAEYSPQSLFADEDGYEDITMLMQNVAFSVPAAAPSLGAGELSYEEKQIRDAVNPFAMINGTQPVDLTPDLKPFIRPKRGRRESPVPSLFRWSLAIKGR